MPTQAINAVSAFTLSVKFSKINHGNASAGEASGKGMIKGTQQLFFSSGAKFRLLKSTVIEGAGRGKRDRANSAGRSIASAPSRVLPTNGDV